MKIWTLIENTTCADYLTAEHGLSLYIETDTHRFLFDAGQTGAFADNAEIMGVDLSRADFAILSHGHYDHGGGLPAFFRRNKTAPVYAAKEAFSPHFSSPERYIGLDPALLESQRILFVEDVLPLLPGITLRPAKEVPCLHPTSGQGMLTMENGILAPEDFRHEQYLLIEENGKRILFSGCSHKGVLNILRHFQPDVFVGGFHFSKLPTDGKELEDAARILSQFPTTYYTGHCTGAAQYAKLKSILGDQLRPLFTGCVLEL